jgi:hypothetical protein
MFDHPTVDALASFLLDRLAPPQPHPQADEAAVRVTASARATLGAHAVAAMSDAEIEALLISRLEPR